MTLRELSDEFQRRFDAKSAAREKALVAARRSIRCSANAIRAILDLLRAGQVETSERILTLMEDMYYVLVCMDYPDAITSNLRRSTDVARGIIEKTRGDLSMSLVQRDLRLALEGHAGRLGPAAKNQADPSGT